MTDEELRKVLKHVKEALNDQLEPLGYPRDEYLLVLANVKIRLVGDMVREYQKRLTESSAASQESEEEK